MFLLQNWALIVLGTRRIVCKSRNAETKVQRRMKKRKYLEREREREERQGKKYW